jgi:hypothetical protein
VPAEDDVAVGEERRAVERPPVGRNRDGATVDESQMRVPVGDA